MIYFLVYLSSAKDLLSDSDLSDILSKSRINNKKLNITGMLLYHEGNLMQILEGEEVTVNNLFYKIEKDKRHSNVAKLISGTSDVRNFPEWSMGFKTESDPEWKNYAGLLRLNASANWKSADLEIQTILNSFMKVNFRT